MGWCSLQFDEIEKAVEKLEKRSRNDCEMMICPKHYTPICGYSSRLEYFICEKCDPKVIGTVLDFKQFTKNYNSIYNEDMDMAMFKRLVSDKLVDAIRGFAYITGRVKSCVHKARELSLGQEGHEEVEKGNISLIGEATTLIAKSKGLLSYDSGLLDQIIGKISIEKAIKRYFDVQKFITVAKMKEIWFYLHRLNVSLMRINCLKVLESVVNLKCLNDEQMCSVVFSDLFKRKASVNCAEDEFCAFDGANLIPEVSKLINTPFRNTEGPIFYTQSLQLKSLHYTGLNIICSLSPTGVLAVYRYNSGNHLLTLHNLLTNEAVDVLWVTDFTTTVFYEKTMFLFVHGCDFVYFKETADCFSGRNNIETFESCPNGGLCLFADPSVAYSTGCVYYTNGDIIDEKLVRFDLKSRTYTEYDFTTEPTISRTGIAMEGISFLANRDKGIIAMDKEGEIRSAIKCSASGFVVLPSRSEPNNLNKSLVIGDGTKCSYSGIDFSIAPAFKPANKLAVVRVYKDVFLVKDKRDNSWRFIRIHVP